MKNYVELVITSESVVASNIVEILAIEPDDSWLSGDLRKGTIIKESDNGCVFKSKLKNDSDFEEHIDNLRSIFKGKEDKIRYMKENYGCEIQLSFVSYYDEPPAINFDYEVIGWLYSIGASADIDLYDCD